MTALPACSPTGGLSGIHTGSRIPGLHTTTSAHVRLPDPVVLPEDWGCSGPDARSTTWGLEEVHGCARRRRERRRNKSGERWKGRGPMMSLRQEGLGVTGGDTRWVRGLSWGTEETMGCNRFTVYVYLISVKRIFHFYTAVCLVLVQHTGSGWNISTTTGWILDYFYWFFFCFCFLQIQIMITILIWSSDFWPHHLVKL